MKLDVRHLVQLAAVAQAGGVTEGAALLGLSQPALSRTLSMLEKRVGASGVVRVGGTPFFMDALIVGMIAEFQNKSPEVRVEQSYGYLPELRAAINADCIDLAICPIDV